LGDPVWPTRDAARSAIFNYIEALNNSIRRHSTLGYLSQSNTVVAADCSIVDAT
jgi:hypothetical protein